MVSTVADQSTGSRGAWPARKQPPPPQARSSTYPRNMPGSNVTMSRRSKAAALRQRTLLTPTSGERKRPPTYLAGRGGPKGGYPSRHPATHPPQHKGQPANRAREQTTTKMSQPERLGREGVAGAGVGRRQMMRAGGDVATDGAAVTPPFTIQGCSLVGVEAVQIVKVIVRDANLMK